MSTQQCKAQRAGIILRANMTSSRVQKLARDARAFNRRHRQLADHVARLGQQHWQAYLADLTALKAEQQELSRKYETWKARLVKSNCELDPHLTKCPAPGYDHPEFTWSM